MLVSEALDRCFSEFLYPAGINRPAYDYLAAGIDGSTFTITLNGRVDKVPNDTILEIESELVLVDMVAAATDIVTAKERGYLETDAVAHAISTKVFIDPMYSRKVVFNTLNTIIGDLYAHGLYVETIDSATTYTAKNTIALPAGGKRILSILVRRQAAFATYRGLRKGYDYTVFEEFDPPQYQLYRGGAEGAAMRIQYAKDFSLAAAESDDLTILGVPLSLQTHLPLGIAGYLLRGREVSRVQIEEVRRALASQGIQVGAALNVGRTMLDEFYGRYVGAERERLRDRHPTEMEYVRS